ncbi:MAG: hypothetical protein WA941_13655 [Nitrososphaeraceae archaeon]
MGIFGRKQKIETEEAEEKELSQQELDNIAKKQTEEDRKQQEELEKAAEIQAEQYKKEALQELNERAKSYKPRWDKNGIIQFKSEYICILQRKWGVQVEFIVAFEDLTREGYRLMAIDEGKTAGDSYSGGTNSYYYFQKMEYVK